MASIMSGWRIIACLFVAIGIAMGSIAVSRYPKLCDLDYSGLVKVIAVMSIVIPCADD